MDGWKSQKCETLNSDENHLEKLDEYVRLVKDGFNNKWNATLPMHFDFLMHDIFGNAEYKVIKQYCFIKNVTKKYLFIVMYSALCKLHVLFIMKTFLLIFSAFVISGSLQPCTYKTLKLKIAR